MELACDEANSSHQPAIGTEHLLIALANDDSGIAINVLRAFDLDQSVIRSEVERRFPGAVHPGSPNLPLTTDSKRVIEFAIREAIALSHEHLGTEHLLMGVADHRPGTAAQVLSDLGAHPEAIRREILNVIENVE